MKSATDLTDDERAAIVARANEVSIKQTAEEFEISPDDVIDLIYGPALPPAPTSVSTSAPIPAPTSEPTLNSDDNDSKLHSDSDKGDNDGDKGNNNNSNNTDNSPKLRPLRELTDAERMEIIRMSNEIGQPKTAEAFNVSLRTVCYCRNEYAHRKDIDTVKRLKTSPKKEKGNNKGFKNASSTVAAQTAEAIQASEAAEAAETVKAVNVAEVDNIAEAVEATEAVKAVKAIKTSVPSNETEKAVEAATPSGKNMPSAFNKDIVELKIENELLKSEISSLKIQLHKLSSAVMKLI